MTCRPIPSTSGCSRGWPWAGGSRREKRMKCLLRRRMKRKPRRAGGPRNRALHVISAVAALCLATVLSVTSLVYAVRFLSADHHYYLATRRIEELNANQGGLEAAIAETRRAVSLDPLQVTYRNELCNLLLQQSQYDQSPRPGLGGCRPDRKRNSRSTPPAPRLTRSRGRPMPTSTGTPGTRSTSWKRRRAWKKHWSSILITRMPGRCWTRWTHRNPARNN